MLAVATSRPAVVASARASASSRARLASPARVLGPARAPARALAAIRGDLARARAAEEERTMSALDAVLGSSDDKEAAEEPASPPPPARAPGGVSPEMKARLLNESVGLGGLPNKPMPANLFLNICVGIAAFAIVAKLGGVLG